MNETDTPPAEGQAIAEKPKSLALNSSWLKVAAAFLIGSLGFVAGVVLGRSADPSGSTAFEALRERVDVLANETTGLRANSELLISRLPALAMLQRSTTFSFNERMYDRVDTSVGPLLVRLDNVEPAEGGFKLTLALGNVHSAAFDGFELGLHWAEGSKRQAFDDTLNPGRWTVAHVLLAPATPAKTSAVTIEASLDKVALYR